MTGETKVTQFTLNSSNIHANLSNSGNISRSATFWKIYVATLFIFSLIGSGILKLQFDVWHILS